MTAYNVVSAAAMQAGQPEDISVVLANFNAIATVLNGGLDNANLNAGAAIVLSKLAGYPADGTKFAAGDGTWKSAGFPAPATTLPGSPSDLQIAVLTDSTTVPTYEWVFVYIAALTKWVFVGGSSGYTVVDTAESLADSAAATAYNALATAGPSFTVPRAGDYLVEVGSLILARTDNGTHQTARHSFDTGGTGAIDNDGAKVKPFNQFSAAQQGGSSATSGPRKKTGLAASTALVSKYKMDGHLNGDTPTPSFTNRWMRVTPIFVT